MKVLLAVDGSRFSGAAADAVARHLRPEGTEVLVLQVIEPRVFSVPPQMASGYEPEQEEFLKGEFRRAEQCVAESAELLRDAGFNATTRVVEGETRMVILDVAAEYGADLIVLGSHGRKGLERLLLGSVADAVSRSASCSVWVVRMPVLHGAGEGIHRS